MNLSSAIINWKNFFRGMVGLEKTYPVKIVRDDKAKQYEMIQASKKGDVGYNLTAVESALIPAMTSHTRIKYTDLMNKYYASRDEAYLEEAEKLVPRAVIPTGVRIQMPSNLWCSIEARSSSSKKLLITPDAIIDSGYTGEMFVVVFNLGFKPYMVEEGEQITQLIFHERIAVNFQEVNELGKTERGESGFGSTGSQARRA